MQMKPVEGQVSLFDLDSQYGKTCPERLAVTKAKISEPSLKPYRPSLKQTFQFLDLKNGIPGGGILGHGWSIAWRVYDAQYWGVPQRRKRIYLVADFGSERTVEILSECEGMCRDSSESAAQGQRTAADAERSAGRSGGTGIAAFMGGQGAKAGGIGYCDDGTTPTLKASPSGGNTVPDVCYALQGNGIDRADTAGCNGSGWRTGQMYTLNTIDRPAVAFAWGNSAKAGLSVICYEGQNVCADTDKCFTLQAGRPDQQHIPTLVYDARGNGDGDTAPTMTGHHNANISDYTAILVEKHE